VIFRPANRNPPAMLPPMTESDASVLVLQAILVLLWWIIASAAVSFAAEKRGSHLWNLFPFESLDLVKK
jgi:hypothetical protein